jgi:hypothetical protein
MTPLEVVVRRPGVSISIAGEPSFRFSDALPNRRPNREVEAGHDRRKEKVENGFVGTFAMTFLNERENTLD